LPASLLDRLGALTDPRGRNGRQYGLVPLVGLCRVGVLAGHTTLAAIAHFVRLRGHRRIGTSGAPRRRRPGAPALAPEAAGEDVCGEHGSERLVSFDPVAAAVAQERHF
jgi:hypothetical protein